MVAILVASTTVPTAAGISVVDTCSLVLGEVLAREALKTTITIPISTLAVPITETVRALPVSMAQEVESSPCHREATSNTATAICPPTTTPRSTEEIVTSAATIRAPDKVVATIIEDAATRMPACATLITMTAGIAGKDGTNSARSPVRRRCQPRPAKTSSERIVTVTVGAVEAAIEALTATVARRHEAVTSATSSDLTTALQIAGETADERVTRARATRTVRITAATATKSEAIKV